MYNLDNTTKKLEERLAKDDFIVVDSSFLIPKIFELEQESREIIKKVWGGEKHAITNLKDLEFGLKEKKISKEEFERCCDFFREYDKINSFLANNSRVYATSSVSEELWDGVDCIKRREKKWKKRIFSEKEQEFWQKDRKKKNMLNRKEQARKTKNILYDMEERTINTSDGKYSSIYSYIPQEFSYADRDTVAAAFYEGLFEHKWCTILTYDTHIYSLFRRAYQDLLGSVAGKYDNFSQQIKDSKVRVLSIQPKGDIITRESTGNIRKEFFKEYFRTRK